MSKIHILFFFISFLFFISCGNERDNNQEKSDNTNQLSELELLNKKILNDLDVGFYKGEFKGKLLMHNSAFNTILGLDASMSLRYYGLFV